MVMGKRVRGLQGPDCEHCCRDQVMYQQRGFHGNTTDYYHEDNSYINRVLETRTGPCVHACARAWAFCVLLLAH